ncbi:MAG: ATP-binding protein [Sphingomonadaceae bacterium]
MSTPLRILIVEDSEDDAELLLLELRRGGYEPSFERVETPEDMAAALRRQEWDIVVSDYVMPRFGGLAALAKLQASGIDIPFIIVSGKIGENVAVEAMKAGAHDYIMKENLTRLVPAIQRELAEAVIRRERKQMEEQLKRAQRLELAGRIAGQVAHDFANLLSPLFGYPQLIRRLLPSDHPAIKYCDALLTNIRQMAAINEDLLTLGRRGRFHQETTDLNELVAMAVSQTPDRPATLTVDLRLANDLPPINCAPAQLLRVIANLISNAREAMGDNGVLTITTAKVVRDRYFGSYNRIAPGEYAMIRVEDTGSGIPEEIIDRVFDPFFTTKRTDERKGSGLGLSIIQAIVDDHKGYVDLESHQGTGTAFSVYLPVQGKADRVAPNGWEQEGALSTS